MPDFETSECYTKQSCSYQASLNYLQHHSKTKALKSICKMPCEFSDILHMQWEKKVEKTENAPFGIVAIVQASLCHWKKTKTVMTQFWDRKPAPGSEWRSIFSSISFPTAAAYERPCAQGTKQEHKERPSEARLQVPAAPGLQQWSSALRHAVRIPLHTF